MLADEIVSELDHSTAIGIMELIMKTGRRLKTTSIMIHHDIELALDYADVIIMLKDETRLVKPELMK